MKFKRGKWAKMSCTYFEIFLEEIFHGVSDKACRQETFLETNKMCGMIIRYSRVPNRSLSQISIQEGKFSMN